MNKKLSYEDCYSILNLNQSSTLTNLNKNWRQLVSHLHPDKCANEAEKIVITEKLKRINCARDILKEYWNKFKQLPLFKINKPSEIPTKNESNPSECAAKSPKPLMKSHQNLRHNDFKFDATIGNKTYGKSDQPSIVKEQKDKYSAKYSAKDTFNNTNFLSSYFSFMLESENQFIIGSALFVLANLYVSITLANWVATLFGVDIVNDDPTSLKGWAIFFLISFVFLSRVFILQYCKFKNKTLG